MDKKKLIIISHVFPYGQYVSFFETEFYQLCRDFEVYLIVAKPHLNEPEIPIPADVHITFLPKLSFKLGKIIELLKNCNTYSEIREYSKKSKKHLLTAILSILIYNYGAIYYREYIEKIVAESRIDAIYTQWCTYLTLASVRVKNKTNNLKVISKFHGFDLYNERRKANWQPFYSEIAEKLDMPVFVCDVGRDYFLKNWKISSNSHPETIYLGCKEMNHAEKHTYKKNELSMVSCSHVISIKRIPLIIQALSEIPEKYVVKWKHIGTGSDIEKCVKLAHDLLDKKTNICWEFAGYIENSKIADLYSDFNADVFISVSSTEGSPLSVQEALSAGIPIIATDVGGTRESLVTLDGRPTGVLLASNPESTAISDTICEFIDFSEDRKAALRQAAIDCWNEKFNAKTNAIFFSQYINSLICNE